MVSQLAAWNGHEGFARLLIDSGIAVNQATEHADTALHIAIRSVHKSIAKSLIEQD